MQGNVAMCGRLNISDDPFVMELINWLGVDSHNPNMRENINWGRFKRATDTISIVRQSEGQRVISDATWWLLLDKTEDGFKPSRYTSFNTRYDKLDVPRSAGYIPFRQSRCIIPAKGFGETEFINKKPVHYYDMEAVDGEAIAFAGLYRQWLHPDTGELRLSCSVITLPPHDKLRHIHSKAMPLILPQNERLVSAWLDPAYQQVENFQFLLNPHLPQDLIAYPIDKPSLHNTIGAAETIVKDRQRAQ
ncbi:SOS response-associated peptidase [Thalassotalea mangrovi]|uniref:Abasic site processing protein n=1 Tax=Thalassotalea mangrovi TaxID=2572245 RepID=A0A4U1BAI6_9GAMM|nr:SOS response-associated peptidase family protein [Thalassotalea mangrovi]TKB47543.1 SOS response-associated peptidase [Thalassotalea mangrovi]